MCSASQFQAGYIPCDFNSFGGYDSNQSMQVFVAGASGGSGKKAVQQLTAKGLSVRAGVRVSWTTF